MFVVQAAWGHLPHWPHVRRIRFRQPSGAGGASRTSALSKTLSRTLSRRFSVMRRPARQRAPRPEGKRGRDGTLLRSMLSPLFLIDIIRLLTISAAQACSAFIPSHFT